MTQPRPQPPPSPEEARVTHIRAAVLRGLQVVAEKQGGAGAWEALLDTLPPATRDVFRGGLGSTRWIEIPHLNELVAAHEARFGAAVASERAIAAVRAQLLEAHPGVLDVLDPTGLVAQAPTLFRLNYRGGRVDVDALAPGHALLSVFADGLFPGWYTTSCPTWICGALDLAGAKDIGFTHHPPVEGNRHRYELRWVEA
jgi:hypothetical protein